jgi:hypothetical protein
MLLLLLLWMMQGGNIIVVMPLFMDGDHSSSCGTDHVGNGHTGIIIDQIIEASFKVKVKVMKMVWLDERTAGGFCVEATESKDAVRLGRLPKSHL